MKKEEMIIKIFEALCSRVVLDDTDVRPINEHWEKAKQMADEIYLEV